MELEPTALEIRAKALRAKALRDSEPFREFIKDAVERIVGDWKAAEDSPEREACHSALRGIRALERALEAAIGNADVLEFTEAKTSRLAKTT